MRALLFIVLFSFIAGCGGYTLVDKNEYEYLKGREEMLEMYSYSEGHTQGYIDSCIFKEDY